MIHVHVWETPTWFQEFQAQLGSGFACSQGKEIPTATQVLVKGRPTDEELQRLPDLTACVVPFAGIPPETRSKLVGYPKVQLYNLHHNAADTAEMAISLYLAASKFLIPRDRALRTGNWSSDSFVHGDENSASIRLADKRALVLGYGAIGQRIVRILEAFGAQVTAVRRKGPFDDLVRPISDLDALLPNAEVLFIALPLTPETEGLLSASHLAALPSGAVISNVARGPIIDEAALYDELSAGRLRAGLDVWWRYPKDDQPTMPSRFPFQDLDNVVMTPHVGGSSDASEAHRWRALVEIIKEIAAGRAHAASLELGY